MRLIFLLLLNVCLMSCSLNSQQAIVRSKNIDLDRFMGKWYVIANIPTFLEKMHSMPLKPMQ